MIAANQKDTQLDIIVDWVSKESFSNPEELIDACNLRFGYQITTEYWEVILGIIETKFSPR